jgi:hypothetical protein
MRLALQAIPIRRAASIAITLPRILNLPPPCFASELLDLELIERLEDVADKATFGTRLVAGRNRVEHLDARAREFSLVRERAE